MKRITSKSSQEQTEPNTEVPYESMESKQENLNNDDFSEKPEVDPGIDYMRWSD